MGYYGYLPSRSLVEVSCSVSHYWEVTGARIIIKHLPFAQHSDRHLNNNNTQLKMSKTRLRMG